MSLNELENRTRSALAQFDNNMGGIFDRQSFYQGDLYDASGGSPKLNKGQLCFKWSIILMNIIFFIFGCILVGLGGYALSNSVGALVGTTVPAGLTAVGVLIILMSIHGGCSSWRENRSCLGLYFIFLLILTIILFAVGVAVYVLKNDAETYVHLGWQRVDDDTRLSLENLFSCCGGTSFNDTPITPRCPFYNYTSLSYIDNIKRPFCVPEIVDQFQSQFVTAGGAAIAFSVLMLLGLIGICYVMHGIKRKAAQTEIAKLRTGSVVASDEISISDANREVSTSQAPSEQYDEENQYAN